MKLIARSEADMKRIGHAIRAMVFPVEVSVKPAENTRSKQANAYYWAFLTEISRQAPAHMGGEYWDPSTWHEYCARRFLGMEPGPFGEGVRKRTSGLKVQEFCDYVAKIEAWAVDEFDLQFEHPKEVAA